MTLPSRYLSIAIHRPAGAVYEYTSKYENLPRWAAGLSTTLKPDGDAWVADSPMGKIRIKMAEKNAFGILDHDVTLPDGKKFYNPMRVIANRDGCDVVFTLFRWEGMTDAEFAKDAAQIETDLRKLKSILEN